MDTAHYALALIAAFAIALCLGTAAVLQKIGADEEKKVRGLDVNLLLELIRDWPYVAGLTLDFVSWLLTLLAVHYLPLFLVQSITAMNIAVTAVLEALLFRRRLGRTRYGALVLILGGLVLLALSAAPGSATHISAATRIAILFGALPLAGIAALLARNRSYLATIGLAALAGIAFGQTAVIGRIFVFYTPLWHNLYNPYILASFANGFLGILLLSIALQRTYATTTSATSTAAQTLIPTCIGVLMLGDGTRPGLGLVALAGILLALGGTLVIASRHGHPRHRLSRVR